MLNLVLAKVLNFKIPELYVWLVIMLSICYRLLFVQTYWISALHKKLVGTRVLSVLDPLLGYVRVYSHCGLSA